jgi:hypothetical protein
MFSKKPIADIKNSKRALRELEKLNDEQEILEAMKSPILQVKLECVKRLSDPQNLASAILDRYERRTAGEALKKITDESALARVAIHHPEYHHDGYDKEAARRIHDPETLLKVFWGCQSSTKVHVETIVAKTLLDLDLPENSKYYADIARKGTQEDALRALDHVTDDDILSRVAHQHGHPRVQLVAAKKMQDKERAQDCSSSIGRNLRGYSQSPVFKEVMEGWTQLFGSTLYTGL